VFRKGEEVPLGPGRVEKVSALWKTAALGKRVQSSVVRKPRGSAIFAREKKKIPDVGRSEQQTDVVTEGEP